MLVKIEARILIFPGTDFHFPSTSVPPGTFLGSETACYKRFSACIHRYSDCVCWFFIITRSFQCMCHAVYVSCSSLSVCLIYNLMGEGVNVLVDSL